MPGTERVLRGQRGRGRQGERRRPHCCLRERTRIRVCTRRTRIRRIRIRLRRGSGRGLRAHDAGQQQLVRFDHHIPLA
jgi:hypothetical protein